MVNRPVGARKMKRVAGLLTVLGLSIDSFAGEIYFHHIGSPPGGDSAYAMSVTSDGTLVVGHADVTGESRYRGFVWTSELGFRWLVDPPGSWGNIFVRDVSDDGRVIVGTATAGGASAAIVWTDGIPINIGYLPGGNEVGGAEAWGVSADGAVVVGTSSSDLGMQAFSWSDGVFTPLGFLEPVAENFSRAYGVSADGSVIVGESTSSRGREAVKWEAGEIFSIGDLPGGLFVGVAKSVTPDGLIIAGRGRIASGHREFRWQDGEMIDLGDIPNGNEYQEPSGISADGSVIGGYGYAMIGDEVIQTAVLWDAVMGMRAVKTVMLEDFGTSLGEFEPYETSGVSADGHILVGYGAIPHTSGHMWIARIEYRCRITDFNFDLRTDLADLSVLLSHFGECSGDPTYFRPADLDGRGCVDLPDLAIMLAEFGTICP
jgi:probable HAF family extracellular repeat protein